ncbi:hypothetical protein Scep_011147 [Stephania cephalantha]|uniref:Uncharacterized protein n=1 Tax=Stephania cephalantha TaxID=152367 RepID=A0AAP0P662_9MAGN
MRRSLGRLASSRGRGRGRGSYANQTLIGTTDFSTFSGGDGRGRGRGLGSPPIFTPQSIGKPESQQPNDAESYDSFVSSTVGVGRGRGKPIAPPPIAPTAPSFPQWIPGINPSVGRGVANRQTQQTHQETQPGQPKKPIFFRREDSIDSTPQKPQFSDLGEAPDEGKSLPIGLIGGMPGIGRGKPVKLSTAEERPVEENRHLRPRRGGEGLRRGGGVEQGERENSRRSPSRLDRYEGDGGGRGGRGGRGQRGRGRGGRGSYGWQQRGGLQRRSGQFQDADEGFASGLYLGDNADGERLAKRVGVESMDKLVEAFEEMSSRVLPSPMDDAYLDALHTNNMIEYEPEYLVEFDNPDIDDKPPIPLRDALEKMKPFLMAYEGIKSQEEWEFEFVVLMSCVHGDAEIIEELMERVPQMKELMDIYCGPDKVTAKQQVAELERVAKTLPDKVPSSVKRFTDRAVLSLKVTPVFSMFYLSLHRLYSAYVTKYATGQNYADGTILSILSVHKKMPRIILSNPGWGFDKKCQFMDKLVWEVSKQYK